jgi:hypothetical protein
MRSLIIKDFTRYMSLSIYLFFWLLMVSLTTLSVALIIWRRILGWLANNKWEKCGNNLTWPDWRNYPDICLENWREPRKTLRIFSVGPRFDLRTLAVQVRSLTCLADFLAYTTYCYGVKENEMEGSYSTHGYYENRMQYFSRKTLLGL